MSDSLLPWSYRLAKVWRDDYTLWATFLYSGVSYLNFAENSPDLGMIFIRDGLLLTGSQSIFYMSVSDSSSVSYPIAWEFSSFASSFYLLFEEFTSFLVLFDRFICFLDSLGSSVSCLPSTVHSSRRAYSIWFLYFWEYPLRSILLLSNLGSLRLGSIYFSLSWRFQIAFFSS